MKRSYYLYDIGLGPKTMTLGTLVWKDYANPHLAHKYVSRFLSDDELASCATSSAVSGIFAAKQTITPHGSLNFAELFEFESSLQNHKARVLVAGGGYRQELMHPSQFLSSTVLSDPKAVKTVRLWLSVARCRYLLKKATFQRPEIWMLTGLYLLHDVKAYNRDRLSSKLSTGVSPQISSLAGGPPIGGSLGFRWDRDLEADLFMPDAHVWAAQWRRLEVEYVLDSHVGVSDQSRSIPCGLYPDVTSQGVLRSDIAAVDQARIGLTTEEPTDRPGSQEKAVAHKIDNKLTDLDVLEPTSMAQECPENFDELFQEALEWFRSELDDDTDEDSE